MGGGQRVHRLPRRLRLCRGVRHRAEVPRGPALQDGAGEPEPRHGLRRRARPRHAAVLLSRRSVPLYLEDFAPGQVRESPPRTLTKDEIIAFAREYDPQPFHVDERAATACSAGALHPESRSATAFAGALRTLGVWGPFRGPHVQTSERHGFCRGAPNAGGLGAISGPPCSDQRAPWLCRGAPNAGGWGPFRGPHVGW